VNDLAEFLLARIAEDGDRPVAKARAVARAAEIGFTSSVRALRLAAAYYSDHPDYREEWRP